MTTPDSDFVMATVARTHGITLSEASAGRIARMMAAMRTALDAAAGGSQFDTEPAQLHCVLTSLAKGKGRHG